MAEKTEKLIQQEIWQRLIRPIYLIDNGLVGDFKEMVKLLKEQNGGIKENANKINRNTIKITAIISLLTGLGILGGLDATVFHKVFGG